MEETWELAALMMDLASYISAHPVSALDALNSKKRGPSGRPIDLLQQSEMDPVLRRDVWSSGWSRIK